MTVGEKKIGTCLFTFDKQAEDGKYKIFATTESGQKVYLESKSAATAQTPLTATETVITVAKTGKRIYIGSDGKRYKQRISVFLER